MICRIGDVVRRGKAVRIDQTIDPATLVAAVREPEGGPDDRVAITAAAPQPVHEHVGFLHTAMGLRTRTALARAARSRGHTTPYDDQLRDVRESLDKLGIEDRTTEAYRKTLAAAQSETERLRERVAATRGRLQERRENGLDTDAVAADLETAIRELSEVETERAAARQQLERERTAARERRDRRERRRRLEDEIANLERRARTHLVDQLSDEFEAALAAVPGDDAGWADNEGTPFTADPLPAALAVTRLAAISAPVVVACQPFESTRAASDWLTAPVIQV